MPATKTHHQVLIIGAGTAGVTVAARLNRMGIKDVAIIDPSTTHYYQPLWTLVGGGITDVKQSARPLQAVIPNETLWIQDSAIAIDPAEQVVTTEHRGEISYDFLVVCPGIQLDWKQTPGIVDTLGTDGVSSNYSPELAPKTWENIRSLRKGTALFTMPSGPIKCAGAPQKIAYLACDYWQRTGVLQDIEVVLAIPTPKIFGIPQFAKPLMDAIERYKIDLRTQSEVIEVKPEVREAVIVDRSAETERSYTVAYDFMHFVPAQSAPDWIKQSPLASEDPKGWIDIDKHTLQHSRFPTIFALGDAGSTPNSKTGAAIRKQAPVVAANLRAAIAGKSPTASYNGYASCPLTTAHNRMVLAEFDYSLTPTPSIPVIDTQKERYDMWLLKRYGLPFMYWNLMLKGIG